MHLFKMPTESSTSRNLKLRSLTVKCMDLAQSHSAWKTTYVVVGFIRDLWLTVSELGDKYWIIHDSEISEINVIQLRPLWCRKRNRTCVATATSFACFWRILLFQVMYITEKALFSSKRLCINDKADNTKSQIISKASIMFFLCCRQKRLLCKWTTV